MAENLRRFSLETNTPTELKIRECMTEVENLGASTTLTNAIYHLDKARNFLADHIDGIEPPKEDDKRIEFTNA